MDSAACGLPAPVDGVTTAVHDDVAVTDDVIYALGLGFGGKLCIHPRQVSTVHAALLPTDMEIDRARRIVEASQGGVTVVDGFMVDKPVIERARRVLMRAQA